MTSDLRPARSARRTAAALACAACLTLPAGATWAEGPDPAEAVGRIVSVDAGGNRLDVICTGALVAPDLVLTAGHCLRAAKDRPQGIGFEAGYDTGRSAGTALGAEILLAPARQGGGHDWANDIALLRLQAPLPAVPPLALAPSPTAPVRLRVYDREMPEAPRDLMDCPLLGVDTPLFLIGCTVITGNSGAPALVRDGDGWAVAGVVVARSGAAALAAMLPEAIAVRIAESAP